MGENQAGRHLAVRFLAWSCRLGTQLLDFIQHSISCFARAASFPVVFVSYIVTWMLPLRGLYLGTRNVVCYDVELLTRTQVIMISG